MYFKFFLFLFLFSTYITKGQNPSIIWENSFILYNNEDSFKTIELRDSTFLSFGYTNSLGTYGCQIWIIKFDKNGGLISQKHLKCNSYVLPQDVKTDNNDNIYLAVGSTAGKYGDKSEVDFGNYDFWIIKFDKFLNIVWDKTFGGNDYDFPTSISIVDENMVYISGTSSSQISGNKTSPNFGNPDFWVVKLDTNGAKIWDKSFGGVGGDFCNDNVEINGIIYLCGHSQIFNNQKSFDYIGDSDLWIMGINHDGNLVFGRQILAFGSDFSKCISNSKDGNIIIGARSGSSQGYDKSQPNYGGIDYWVLKMSLNGDIIWDKNFGGSENDYISDIAVDPQLNLFLFGGSSSGLNGNKQSPSKGWVDFWIIKTNINGQKVWERTYGSNSYEVAERVIISNDNYIYLTGESSGKNSFDKSSIAQNMDPWFLKIKDCPIIQDPDPITDTVNIGRPHTFHNSTCQNQTIWYDSNFNKITLSNNLITAPVVQNSIYYIKCISDGCISQNYVLVDLKTKCPENYILGSSDNPSGNYYSKNFIRINGFIDQNSSLFSNGYITLEPGFRLENGTVFLASPYGCSN